MQITDSGLRELFATFSAAYNEAMDGTRPDYDALKGRLFQEYMSGGASNIYPFVPDSPEWREWIGERQWQQLEAHKFEVLNRLFEKSVVVPRDTLEDDTYGIYVPRVREAGAGWFSMLRRLAITTALANPICFNGKAIMAVDHSYRAGNTIANLTTDALSATSFEAALAASQGWQWANGEPMTTYWTHLYVGESLRTTAFNIVKNSKIAVAVGEAAAVALDNPNQGRVELEVLPEITGSQWLLVGSSLSGPAASTFGMRPFGVQIRRQPVPQNNDARDVELTGLAKFFASGRAEAFPTLPHLVYGRVAA